MAILIISLVIIYVLFAWIILHRLKDDDERFTTKEIEDLEKRDHKDI